MEVEKLHNWIPKESVVEKKTHAQRVQIRRSLFTIRVPWVLETFLARSGELGGENCSSDVKTHNGHLPPTQKDQKYKHKHTHTKHLKLLL